MRTHKLKTWESMFLEVRAGRKRAEFRRNDRDFAVGDRVALERYRPGYYRPSIGDGGAYLNKDGFATSTPAEVDVENVIITHIANGGFGIPEGYVMFSFRREEEAP